MKNTSAKDAFKKKKESDQKRDALLAAVLPFVCIVLSVFLLACLIFEGSVGVIGRAISHALRGFFAAGSFLFVALLLYNAIFFKRNSEDGTAHSKMIFSAAALLLSDMLFYLVSVLAGAAGTFDIAAFWENGIGWTGGGVIGGILGCLFYKLLGSVGSMILVSAALFLSVLLLFGITPRMVWVYIAFKIKRARDKVREENEKLAEREEKLKSELDEADEPEQLPVPEARGRKRKKFDPDVEIDEPDEDAIYDEVVRRTEETYGPVDESVFDAAMNDTTETLRAENAPAEGDELDLRKIFQNPEDATVLEKYTGDPDADAAELEFPIEKTPVSDEAESAPFITPAAEPEKPAYVFPPLDLLSPGAAPKNVNVEAELRENAAKLVETLSAFNVKTKISGYSRGPTITRYELVPEAGTRVRSIVNLVDDIALNLATSGVRTEAPIAGKPAVGIEVPNKTAATVHVRELIETDGFRNAESRLTAVLGKDVAGAPMLINIAKMPHLLIAGATGMGKSVCINSLLISLLYKASPEEVKLILIDPKKVELNIYNGLPHLLVPVVSDPKKAAGSLSWAVGEMERRFELIESVGMRDLAGYNAITKDDPEHAYMPQVVIIIDELADLMMTAPDSVEDSICRLAQKARAAGMHLIIGTQRPSVDVVTGLIKSNIPSRIAFTVASQVDSRTIIDIAGAEKLIGRGDMLYAPVGASKPMRVQGAFVSEGEVESVIEFIKAEGKEASYDASVIESIEKEAAKCAAPKKGAAPAADDGEDADPMLRAAIELAVDSGKISTSLIQRRLSLGYGRAAKLIDKMEALGYVGAPEGQKPREVLITKQQYMEMVLRDEDQIPQ